MENSPYQTPLKTFGRVQLKCNDSSRTKQHFQKECDINTIMTKYNKTGLISHVAKHQGSYDDLPNQQDYHESILEIQAANDSFNSLPSDVRNFFENDAGQFLDFVQNPNNTDEMRELGLIPQLAQRAVDPSSLPIEDKPSESPETAPDSE
jgi:phage internal scaffolding protein